MSDEIFDRMYELQKQMRGRRYDGHQSDVAQVVDDAERALVAAGKFGEWERHEIEQARRAVRINYLTLALNCVGKAVEVSYLSPADYEAGFHYGKRSSADHKS